MSEIDKKRGWDVKAAFKRVADAAGMTVEEYEAYLYRRVTNPTPQETEEFDKFVEQLHSTPGWYGENIEPVKPQRRAILSGDEWFGLVVVLCIGIIAAVAVWRIL